MNAQKRVDVLAIVDACIAKRDLNYDDMVAARAALAHLINETKKLSTWSEAFAYTGKCWPTPKAWKVSEAKEIIGKQAFEVRKAIDDVGGASW